MEVLVRQAAVAHLYLCYWLGWVYISALIKSTQKEYADTAIGLAGNDLSYKQAAQIFQEKLGQPLPTTFDLVINGTMWAVRDFGLMFKGFRTDDFDADIAALKKPHPDMWLSGIGYIQEVVTLLLNCSLGSVVLLPRC